MKRIEDEWSEYINTVSLYEGYNYSCLKKIKISGKKQAYGGCCFASGHLLGIANSSRDVLDVNINDCTVKSFGRTKIGTFKWTGGCEFRGKCYGFPRKENSLLVIDYIERNIYEQPLDINYRGEHHYGGTVTLEGIVYQPPRNTNHILKIDLNTFEIKKIPMPQIDVDCRYSSSVLHPSGDIYLMPEFGNRMAVIHTDFDEVEYFERKSDHLVFGMVVGFDGNIYGFSKEGDGILCIDTKGRRVDYLHREIENPDCYGTVVGINGCLYGVPAGGQQIWEYNIKSQTVQKIFELDEHGIAKCGGGGIYSDGSIVFMPCYGDYVYYLQLEYAPILLKGITQNVFLNSNF